MSDRYYIYCKHEGEKLVPIGYADYDGFVTIKGQEDFQRDSRGMPDDQPLIEASEVIVTFKDNSDYIQPLIEALMREDWEVIEGWVEDLTTMV